MEKLVEGVHTFHTRYFASHRALFRRLAERGQHPETAFITCSDSRVVPNLITSTEPGELFIVRNLGNIVPHVTLPGGTAAAIEYAIEVLCVGNVIVCGHTGCGAIESALEPERTKNLPFVKKWLAQTERLRAIVSERYANLEGEARMTAAVEENVLVQLENLRAFPCVGQRLDRGELRLSGWIFQIATGEVFEFDPSVGQFAPVRSASIRPGGSTSSLPPLPPNGGSRAT
jgi:carbonic anhydrase